MARAKKKRPALRVELGWSSLLAVAVVCFCIFLWMFLFGVWTGQTLLTPGNDTAEQIQEMAGRIWQERGGERRKEISTPRRAKESAPKGLVRRKPSHKRPDGAAGNSFFALQVAAFRDSAKARKVVLQWRARDYHAFYLPPKSADSTFYRVFVGHFADMSAAKKRAAEFAKDGKTKYFITLISGEEAQLP